jgi:hypothetical protein
MVSLQRALARTQPQPFITVSACPSMVFGGSPQGMDRCTQAVLEGSSILTHWEVPPEPPPPKTTSANSSSDVPAAGRMQHVVQCAALIGQPLLSMANQLQSLLLLHIPPPSCMCFSRQLSRPAFDTLPLRCNDRTLSDVSRSLKTGTADGIYPNTYEMLQVAAFGHCVQGLDKIGVFINATLAFKVQRTLPPR